MLFAEVVDRTPLTVADAAEEGEDRLFRVVFGKLLRPASGRALDPPDIELPTPVGVPLLLLVKGAASLAFVLVPDLTVVVADVCLQHGEHGVLVGLADIACDDRGKVQGGVADPG